VRIDTGTMSTQSMYGTRNVTPFTINIQPDILDTINNYYSLLNYTTIINKT